MVEEITPQMKKELANFQKCEVVDLDSSMAYLRGKHGVVEIRLEYGSFGDYSAKYVVEKFGERGKLFSGKNAVSRIKKYLGEC